MPNLVASLKQEIRRVARKEIREQVSATKRATAQHRRDITTLKRQMMSQEQRIASLESAAGKAEAGPTVIESAAEGVRFSARSVRAQRKRLKLSAEDFAKLIGVSAQTIYNWELGKVRPREAQFSALVAIRSLNRREALRRVRAAQS